MLVDQTLVWKAVNYGRLEEVEKRMMVSEVNILRELRSPFVVKYHDRIVDRKAKTLYIVMENCAGERARAAAVGWQTTLQPLKRCSSASAANALP